MADMARRQGLLNSASNHLNRGSSRSASSGAGRVGKTLGALYLSQLIPALLLVVYGVVVIWSNEKMPCTFATSTYALATSVDS